MSGTAEIRTFEYEIRLASVTIAGLPKLERNNIIIPITDCAICFCDGPGDCVFAMISGSDGQASPGKNESLIMP